MSEVALYVGEALARYGFPGGHPFGPDRHDAFWQETQARGLQRLVDVRDPVRATREVLERFHYGAYVDAVARQSETGAGYLDYGDTPAFQGCFEASAAVVGSSLDAAIRIMEGSCLRAFVPIAGLHHSRPDRAGGFCIFNDCGVVIKTLQQQYGLQRIAYVDIDAHHGDGVYYPFVEDPGVIIADIHQSGIYPGTGSEQERGEGVARGTKLNLPQAAGADDDAFFPAWEQLEAFVAEARPEFVVLQCGADSIAGDPLTDLRFSPAAHRHAARRLRSLADTHASGRLLATGGGGYNRANLATAWNEVLEALL